MILIAAALFTACTQPEEKKDNINLSVDHQHMDKTNSMMKAMDESMLAMHKVRLTGNSDYDFAAMMVPHHKERLLWQKI